MKMIDGGVCAAKGFKAGAVHVGIRRSQSKKDVAIICSDVPCSAAGVFTKNVVKAHPVQLDQKRLENGRAQAVIVNSGIANACAPKGMEHAIEEAKIGADFLGLPEEDVLVSSTGVIGMELNVQIIRDNIGGLELKYDNSMEAARAIMTTDTVPKYAAAEFEVDGKVCRIGGICKGSGMIHPNMGTLLCYITTDCKVAAPMLKKALTANVRTTFNRVSIDGDTSTNDSCIIFANGLAGNEEIASEGAGFDAFCEALHAVMEDLTKKVAADGEGATRLLTVHVTGAKSEEAAEILAKSVGSSSLMKCAIFGADANWGRVLCAMGYAGIDFDPEGVDVTFTSAEGEIAVCKNGRGLYFDEALAKKVLKASEVTIEIALHEGDGEVTCWGCDLTYDYVKINGDYRS